MAKVDNTNKGKYVTYWEYLDKTKGPVAPVDINDDLAEKYSEEIVARAEALKGYNTAYYTDNGELGDLMLSDQDYIQFALQERYEAVVNGMKSIFDSRIAFMGIPDPEWAVYSYEEILEMENNGVHIPDDVLKWAHSMQQADVNAVSTSGEVDGDDGEDNSIDSLKDKAKKYIKDSEKAVEDTNAQFETYKEKAQEAMQLKKAKQDTYKAEMDEIAKMTDEWKALNEKSKSGQLSKAENKRLQELAKKINGQNGTVMKEMQAADAQLDSFLESFNGLDAKIQENMVLISDTEKAAKDLLDLEKSFTGEFIPVALTERAADSGLLINPLQGAKGDSIAEVAMEAAQDLTECNDAVSSVVYDSENTELTQFATEYTKAATETEENTKETMGEAFNQASPENKPKDKVDSGIPIIFSFANSMYATAKTLATTIELKSQDKKMMSRKKSLVKELHQSDKEIKTVNKEIAATQSTQESNASEEEAFLAKLDEIKGQQSNEEMTSESEGEGGVTSSATNETEEICTNLESLDNENDQATKGLQKAVGKSLAVSKKSQNLSKLLRGESVDLEKQKKVSVKTAEDTMIVGVGTTSLGIVTTAIGDAVCATAYTMLMSVYPPTVLAGAQLLQQGLLLLALGRLEMTTGITASVTGATTLAVAANVDDDLQESESTQKETTQLAKENQQVVKTASAVVVNDDGNAAETLSANAPTTSSTTSDASATTDVAPAATVDMVPMVKTKMATAGSSDEGDSAESTTDTNEATVPTTSDMTDSSNNGTTGGNTSNTANTKADTVTTGTTGGVVAEGSVAQEASANEGAEEEGRDDKLIYAPGIAGCYSVAAANTAAIAGVLADKKEMDKDKRAYLNNLKSMETISKNLERQEALLTKIHEKLALKADSLTGKIEESNAIITDAGENGEQDKVAVAQIDAQNASNELTTVEKGAKTTSFDSAVAKGNKQITALDKDANVIKNGLNKYEKSLDNLSKVSIGALAVGAPTTALGVLGTVLGNQQLATGTQYMIRAALLPTVGLFEGIRAYYIAMGTASLAKGTHNVTFGALNIAAGSTALASGAAGLAVRSDAKGHKKEVEAEFKAGLPKSKEGKGIVRQSLQSVRAASNETNSKLAGVPEVATSSAAASANTNTANSYESDDKVDRKLARFNNDSIIESKKKKKKVQGVSASARG